MLAFAVRRLIEALFVMLTVAALAFAMFRFVGDPVNQIVGQDASIADRTRIRQTLGLDDPIIAQFARFIGRAAQFDFGSSYQMKQPVAALIGSRLPASMELAGAATLLALIVAIPIGVYTSIRRDSLLSGFFLTASLIGASLPGFLVGILLIYIFGVTLKCLPFPGRGDVVQIGFWSTGLLTRSGLLSLIMPAATLGLFQMAFVMRLVRAEMSDILRSDYIRFARARGIPGRIIYFRHALKNALVPVAAIIGLQTGAVVAFAVITETVFQWPGVGLLFLTAVQQADIPVMAAYMMLCALLFTTINSIVDLFYVAIDPRIRIGKR